MPRVLNPARAASRAYLLRFKQNSICACGESNPACLELHHRDPKTKSDDVSRLAKDGRLEALKAELKKCDVLCKNCHAKGHRYRAPLLEIPVESVRELAGLRAICPSCDRSGRLDVSGLPWAAVEGNAIFWSEGRWRCMDQNCEERGEA